MTIDTQDQSLPPYATAARLIAAVQAMVRLLNEKRQERLTDSAILTMGERQRVDLGLGEFVRSTANFTSR